MEEFLVIIFFMMFFGVPAVIIFQLFKFFNGFVQGHKEGKEQFLGKQTPLKIRAELEEITNTYTAKRSQFEAEFKNAKSNNPITIREQDISERREDYITIIKLNNYDLKRTYSVLTAHLQNQATIVDGLLRAFIEKFPDVEPEVEAPPAPPVEDPEGSQGPAGDPGRDGRDGRDGKDGKDGRDGRDGATPYVGGNGNWFIGDKDTGVPAQGKDGKDGLTPRVGDNGNWWIGDKDTGINAQGKDGQTPRVGDNGNWWIGDTDTGISAKGKDGKDGKDGADGVTPEIRDGVWWIGDTNTNIPASGQTPRIGDNGNWFIGDTDTGIPAKGEKGDTGETGQTPRIGDNGNWWIGDTNTGLPARGLVGEKGATPEIRDGVWWIGDTNTGIPATVLPTIGENGNWFINGKDTGMPSRGNDGRDGRDNNAPVTGFQTVYLDNGKKAPLVNTGGAVEGHGFFAWLKSLFTR